MARSRSSGSAQYGFQVHIYCKVPSFNLCMTQVSVMCSLAHELADGKEIPRGLHQRRSSGLGRRSAGRRRKRRLRHLRRLLQRPRLLHQKERLLAFSLALFFTDVIGRITAVTDIVVVHSQYHPEPSDTRTIVLQDQAQNEINLVLWGARAREFDAEEVRAASETQAVIAIFVGTLPKMYRGVKGLSGSSACRWYIDEDLPEINAFRASLPEGFAPITAHIPGEQPMVAPAVREPPVELSVQELLNLDPFDNMKKQFMVKVVITRLGYDNHWWFLSCRKCHKTAHLYKYLLL